MTHGNTREINLINIKQPLRFNYSLSEGAGMLFHLKPELNSQQRRLLPCGHRPSQATKASSSAQDSL